MPVRKELALLERAALLLRELAPRVPSNGQRLRQRTSRLASTIEKFLSERDRSQNSQ